MKTFLVKALCMPFSGEPISNPGDLLQYMGIMGAFVLLIHPFNTMPSLEWRMNKPQQHRRGQSRGGHSRLRNGSKELCVWMCVWRPLRGRDCDARSSPASNNSYTDNTWCSRLHWPHCTMICSYSTMLFIKTHTCLTNAAVTRNPNIHCGCCISSCGKYCVV